MTSRLGKLCGALIGVTAVLVTVIGIPAAATPAPIGMISAFFDPEVNGEGITEGPDGAVWFANQDLDSIGRFTVAGSVTSFSDPTIDTPDAITTGADGNLWFNSTENSDTVFRMTTAGVVTSFTDAGISDPSSLTQGPDGNVWFTSSGNGKVGKITPLGAITMYTDPSLVTPRIITSGPDGNLWFTNEDGGSIGQITTAGVISVFASPDIDSPAGIVAGPDGALWFTNYYNDTIGRITTAGVITIFSAGANERPRSITAGADGNLWFTANESDTIGRITTAGVVTTFEHPSIREPRDITSGPDGTLWFTNNSNNALGRVIPGGGVSQCGAGEPGPFTDVSGTHPFCDDIEWLADAGVSGGFPDGSFRSTAPVTRQSMSAFLYRFGGRDRNTPPAEPTFSDVPNDHPFHFEIEWVVQQSLAEGFPDGTYRPGAPVTRQSMAAFLYRVAYQPEFTPPAVATFPDVPTDHPFFKEIEWLVSTGITEGFPDGSYRPGSAVTRQSMAAFLHRLEAGDF